MLLAGACCKRRRREPAEARVWSCRVIVYTPRFDDPANLGEMGGEQVLVSAVVAGYRAGRSRLSTMRSSSRATRDAREREVDHQSKAFASEVVEHSQHPKHPAAGPAPDTKSNDKR